MKPEIKSICLRLQFHLLSFGQKKNMAYLFLINSLVMRMPYCLLVSTCVSFCPSLVFSFITISEGEYLFSWLHWSVWIEYPSLPVVVDVYVVMHLSLSLDSMIFVLYQFMKDRTNFLLCGLSYTEYITERCMCNLNKIRLWLETTVCLCHELTEN